MYRPIPNIIHEYKKKVVFTFTYKCISPSSMAIDTFLFKD